MLLSLNLIIGHVERIKKMRCQVSAPPLAAGATNFIGEATLKIHTRCQVLGVRDASAETGILPEAGKPGILNIDRNIKALNT